MVPLAARLIAAHHSTGPLDEAVECKVRGLHICRGRAVVALIRPLWSVTQPSGLPVSYARTTLTQWATAGSPEVFATHIALAQDELCPGMAQRQAQLRQEIPHFPPSEPSKGPQSRHCQMQILLNRHTIGACGQLSIPRTRPARCHEGPAPMASSVSDANAAEMVLAEGSPQGPVMPLASGHPHTSIL